MQSLIQTSFDATTASSISLKDTILEDVLGQCSQATKIQVVNLVYEQLRKEVAAKAKEQEYQLKQTQAELETFTFQPKVK